MSPPFGKELVYSLALFVSLVNSLRTIITTDQTTGERHPKLLAALLKAHSGQRDGKAVPLFGMNLIPETEGVIHVGTEITDITYGPRPEL